MGRKSLYFITESWRKMLLFKGHALDTLAESLNIFLKCEKIIGSVC